MTTEAQRKKRREYFRGYRARKKAEKLMVEKQEGKPTPIAERVAEAQNAKSEPITSEMLDEGEKKLKDSKRFERHLGFEDATAIKGPIDPSTGKPKYAFRLLHDMHRKRRGGLGSWKLLTPQKMKAEGIELPNNPVPQHIQRGSDNKVYFMDMYWGYRPYDVNEAERRRISEASTRNVRMSENMDALAEKLKAQFGNQQSLEIMDAFVKLRNETTGKKYY